MENPTLPLKGSYALVFRMKHTYNLSIGRLGHHHFLPGYYIYLGSALGPGGITARIRRHLRYSYKKAPHWHVDRLLGVSRISEIWWKAGTESVECLWAVRLAKIGSIHIAGFGASDCRCAGHLVHFNYLNEVSNGYRLFENETCRHVIGVSVPT